MFADAVELGGVKPSADTVLSEKPMKFLSKIHGAQYCFLASLW